MLQKSAFNLFYTRLQTENDVVVQLSLKRWLVATGPHPAVTRPGMEGEGLQDQYPGQPVIHRRPLVLCQGTHI